MAAIPEGVQVLFDDVTIETSDASSESAETTDTAKRDFHQEAYPSYVPPNKRGHNLQQDKFVNFKNTPAGEKDKVEGVDNDKYQRLMLRVPMALPRDKLTRLKADFPGVYFHCSDNGNHDHPYSHVVTMIGTRFMQRRIKPGSSVLDVYGNPNACDAFNKSQANAPDPKQMRALVNRCGPADFIREVNKWGAQIDDDTQEERYNMGSLRSMINSGELSKYNVLQFVHTMYYVDFAEIADALHAPCDKGKRVAYALVHRHSLQKGTINDGEQEYIKRFVGDRWLVKQTNVASGSAYVHPDLSEVLFRQNKVWLPKERLDLRHSGHVAEVLFQNEAASGGSKQSVARDPTKGLAWDVHKINDETWVVEMVAYVDQVLDGVVDFAQQWEDDEMLSVDDHMTTPSVSSADQSITDDGGFVTIPTPDGKFLQMEIPSRELFDHLRLMTIGRKRDDKLLEQLISAANHLVNPSALFGGKLGMRCPPDKVYDVAVAAFMIDVQKEAAITGQIADLKPVLQRHARNRKLGPSFKNASIRDLMDMLRASLSVAQAVNKTVRAKDPVDAGLEHLQSMLN